MYMKIVIRQIKNLIVKDKFKIFREINRKISLWENLIFLSSENFFKEDRKCIIIKVKIDNLYYIKN